MHPPPRPVSAVRSALSPLLLCSALLSSVRLLRLGEAKVRREKQLFAVPQACIPLCLQRGEHDDEQRERQR